MLENGRPWAFDKSGNKMFGFFHNEPLADGMAMAILPGNATPIEIAGLLFEDIERTTKNGLLPQP